MATEVTITADTQEACLTSVVEGRLLTVVTELMILAEGGKIKLPIVVGATVPLVGAIVLLVGVIVLAVGRTFVAVGVLVVMVQHL